MFCRFVRERNKKKKHAKSLYINMWSIICVNQKKEYRWIILTQIMWLICNRYIRILTVPDLPLLTPPTTGFTVYFISDYFQVVFTVSVLCILKLLFRCCVVCKAGYCFAVHKTWGRCSDQDTCSVEQSCINEQTVRNVKTFFAKLLTIYGHRLFTGNQIM